jgi:hypothetical protein
LWNITTTRKLFFTERFFPVRGGDGSAVFYGGGIVIFNFEVIASRFFEINRVSKVGFVGLGDTLNLILSFVIGKIFVRFRDLFRAPDPEAIMVSVRLVRCVGSSVFGCFNSASFSFRSTTSSASKSVKIGRVSSSERHS